MELLIVIIIIGVLASLIFANFAGVRQRGRDSQRKSDMKQIQTALELYRADRRSYPTIPNPISPCGVPFTYEGTTYMQKVPCGPGGSSAYQYLSDGTIYCIRACLENSNDPQKDEPNNSEPSECSSLPDCDSSRPSYTVQNP